MPWKLTALTDVFVALKLRAKVKKGFKIRVVKFRFFVNISLPFSFQVWTEAKLGFQARFTKLQFLRGSN